MMGYSRSIALMVDGLLAPCSDGATRRFVELAKTLKNLGFKVVVVLAHRGWSDVKMLQQLPFEVILVSVEDYYHGTDVISDVFDYLRPDFIQCKEPEMLASLVLRKLVPDSSALVFDCHDVKGWRSREDGFACHLCDYTVCISESETHLLAKSAGIELDRVSYLPFSIKGDYFFSILENDNVKNIAFLGHFFYEPNAEALIWICENLLPILCKQEPDIVLHVFGHCPAYLTGKLNSKNVKFHGFVNDLYPALRECELAFSIVFSGTGARIKTYDYIIAGIPIVANVLGFQGIGIVPNVEIAGTPEDLVGLTLRYITDKRLREKCIKYCQEYLLKKFSGPFVDDLYLEFYNRSLQSRPKGELYDRVARYCASMGISDFSAFIADIAASPQPWISELLQKNRFDFVDQGGIKTGEWQILAGLDKV